MHETGIVRDLVRRLEKVARDGGAERVSGVVVWLGALSQFSPEHFREHFDEEARGTVAEGAALRSRCRRTSDIRSAQNVMMQSIDLDIRRWRRVRCHERTPALTMQSEPRQRLRLDVTGAVQGVGFRPFVHRLAVSEGLGGFVRNTGEGVSLEVEGPLPALDRFLARLDARDCTAGRHLREASASASRPRRKRLCDHAKRAAPASVRPSCCPISRPARNASKRSSIRAIAAIAIRSRPASIAARVTASLKLFPTTGPARPCDAFLCAPPVWPSTKTRAPVAFMPKPTPVRIAVPRLALWNAAGNVLATGHQALKSAADALRQGVIVALKGLGGFQLLVDARNDAAVRRLRDRKRASGEAVRDHGSDACRC